MQDEIFGPILPIKTYETLDGAIDYVNDRPRPLALYIMGYDEAETERVLSKTVSGGVCVNDTMLHVGIADQQDAFDPLQVLTAEPSLLVILDRIEAELVAADDPRATRAGDLVRLARHSLEVATAT